jgi:luciferase family oxidoreductase group 1
MAENQFASIQFGILDFGLPSPISHGNALLDIVEVVGRAEALGFSRFWLGEHHDVSTSFGECPELLLPVLAGTTERIRVGVGAVLIGYYSPYKIASQFRLLEALYPGRIDLAVGRGRIALPGADWALRDGREAGPPGQLAASVFERKCVELVSFVRKDLPSCHLAHGIPFNPDIEESCEVWLCGGHGAAQLAAHLGVGLAVSMFHSVNAANVDPTIIRDYRARFCAREKGPADASAMIAICGACCDGEREAKRIEQSWTEGFAGPTFYQLMPTVIGTPDQWREQVAALVQAHRPDEIMILDICSDPADKLRSLELMAEAFGLGDVARTRDVQSIPLTVAS